MANVSRNWEKLTGVANPARTQLEVGDQGLTILFNVRGDADNEAFKLSFRRAMGIECPLAPNISASNGDIGVLWLGPNEWLVVAAADRRQAVIESLQSQFRDVPHVITDVSASRVILSLSGKYARLVLAKGCTLDMHESAFSFPQCAQTLLAKAQVLIQCRSNNSGFLLFVANSFARYLEEWLSDAVSECDKSSKVDGDRIALRLLAEGIDIDRSTDILLQRKAIGTKQS